MSTEPTTTGAEQPLTIPDPRPPRPEVIDVRDAVDHAAEGRRTAVLGLGLVAVAPLVVVAVDPDAAPFVLPITVLAGVGAFLAHRFGTWSKVVAAVLGVLALVGTMGGPAAIGLRRPDSVFDFVPAWMLALGAVLAIVGGLTGSLAQRRGRAPDLRAVRRGALGTLGVLAVLSAATSVVVDDTIDEALLSGATVVELSESVFTPTTVAVAAGEQVRLAIRNSGSVIHTFTMDRYGIDVELAPGSERLVEFTATGDGLQQFWCRPHSEVEADGRRDGMVGDLQVAP